MNVVTPIPHTADTSPQDEPGPRSPFTALEDHIIYVEAVFRALRRVDEHSEDEEDESAKTVLIEMLEGHIDGLRAAYEAATEERAAERAAARKVA